MSWVEFVGQITELVEKALSDILLNENLLGRGDHLSFSLSVGREMDVFAAHHRFQLEAELVLFLLECRSALLWV